MEAVTSNFAPDSLDKIHANLILLDEWINSKKGHMLCRQIKSTARMAKVRIIIFSTASNIMDIVKTCGADGYVQKPFDRDILLAEIKKFQPLSAESLSPEV